MRLVRVRGTSVGVRGKCRGGDLGYILALGKKPDWRGDENRNARRKKGCILPGKRNKFEDGGATCSLTKRGEEGVHSAEMMGVRERGNVWV